MGFTTYTRNMEQVAVHMYQHIVVYIHQVWSSFCMHLMLQY